jgi:ParB-like nuclease domain
MNAVTTQKNYSGVIFQISEIQVAVENNLIYDHFGIDNADDRDLAISIRDNGIQEPLTVSIDGILLSGHRRFAAARLLGMDTVPVRIDETVVFKNLTPDDRLAILRLYNQQREKSAGERIREKMVTIDKSEAYCHLKQRRIDILKMAGCEKSNVPMGQVKVRPRITTLGFLNAVKKVVQENKEYWPLTDRRIHYLLLNDPPFRHDKKKTSKYINDASCYDATTRLLARARLTGDVSWEAIEDPTRPVQLGRGFSTFEQFVSQETEYFLSGYSRNLMQGQHDHIEIMLEKNALRTVIQSVAAEYCIPITTTRGFSSLAPRYDLYKRFTKSGKQNLILLMLTDFDPDGDEIAASFARSLRDDFGIANIHPVKVALTSEDVANHDLPSDMDAKVSSPNYQKFLKRYGATKVVELDACPVKLLQSKLRDAIHSVIDVDEFNAQRKNEEQDAAHIEAHRQVVFDAIGGGGHG